MTTKQTKGLRVIAILFAVSYLALYADGVAQGFLSIEQALTEIAVIAGIVGLTFLVAYGIKHRKIPVIVIGSVVLLALDLGTGLFLGIREEPLLWSLPELIPLFLGLALFVWLFDLRPSRNS